MDHDKVYKLLHIVDLARHWPKLQRVHDEAMRELEGLEDENLIAAQKKIRLMVDQLAKSDNALQKANADLQHLQVDHDKLKNAHEAVIATNKRLVEEKNSLLAQVSDSNKVGLASLPDVRREGAPHADT